MAEQPHWHPITMLATVARHIDGMVEADQEQLTTLQEARTKPYVLNDYTVSRVKQAFTTQRKDFPTGCATCTTFHHRHRRRSRLIETVEF